MRVILFPLCVKKFLKLWLPIYMKLRILHPTRIIQIYWCMQLPSKYLLFRLINLQQILLHHWKRFSLLLKIRIQKLLV